MAAALILWSLLAFSPPLVHPGRSAVRMSSSGFGEKKLVGKDAAKGRTRPGGQYDDLKARGQPEYDIFVRADAASEWLNAGVLCVPRTASVREAVSKAIYSREAELLGAVARMYPTLLAKDADPASLEFGYRLSGFEDPVVSAERSLAADTKNFVQKWFADLSNPLNRE